VYIHVKLEYQSKVLLGLFPITEQWVLFVSQVMSANWSPEASVSSEIIVGVSRRPSGSY
jgi:hypothetical protein